MRLVWKWTAFAVLMAGVIFLLYLAFQDAEQYAKIKEQEWISHKNAWFLSCLTEKKQYECEILWKELNVRKHL